MKDISVNFHLFDGSPESAPELDKLLVVYDGGYLWSGKVKTIRAFHGESALEVQTINSIGAFFVAPVMWVYEDELFKACPEIQKKCEIN